MADDRRRMTIEEKEELAKIIAEAISLKQPTECHAFTGEEREAIRDIVKVKKRAIQTTLWVVGAIFIWVAKEIGTFIYSHVTFGWLGK